MDAQSTFESFSDIQPEQLPPEVPLRPPAIVKKDFLDTIKKLSYSRHAWQVWADFNELAAITISNQAVCFDQELEDRYLDIVGRYDEGEPELFGHMLKLTFEALQGELTDFLGQIFMELELGSHWHGQFFTPYHLCKAIAHITFDMQLLDQKEVLKVNEPATGAGAMVIALCEYLDESNINYAHRIHVVAQDLDFTAVCMCYIQLSIIGCSAHVIHGNTLLMETKQVFVTPAAAIYGRIGESK